jgi:hypothetical protein
MPRLGLLRRRLVSRTALAAGLVLAAAIALATSTSGLPEHQLPDHGVPFGAFLGSDDSGVRNIAGFSAWAGREPIVGHTYLPGGSWTDLDQSTGLLDPWLAWRKAQADRILVLNVPMLEPNEPPLPADQVVDLLHRSAAGEFDAHFQALGHELVAGGGEDTIIVLGWEMNSVNYSGRCAPDPAAWQADWRHLVSVLRSVPGQRFRFDYAPDRGPDAVPWTACYPGDDVVDVLGMDTYDQAPGRTFDEFVQGPLGLQAQADFGALHHKPLSFPEWGLFRYGDDPAYVTSMLHWISTHDTLYETIADYCPAGVWRCATNPESSAAYLAGIRRPGGAAASSGP